MSGPVGSHDPRTSFKYTWLVETVQSPKERPFPPSTLGRTPGGLLVLTTLGHWRWCFKVLISVALTLRSGCFGRGSDQGWGGEQCSRE